MSESLFPVARGEWDYEWLADNRRGRVYEDGRGQIGEFDNEEDAKLAVHAVNAIRSLGRTAE